MPATNHAQLNSRGEAIVVEEWPLQFIPVSKALEEEAYLNAATLDFEGEPVRVILAEHLVAIMLQAGRLKDLARVQMFLTQDAVDRDILLDIINRHDLQQQWNDFFRSWIIMSNDNLCKSYVDAADLYRRKEAHRKNEAKRPVSEKMAAVARLRDFERQLEDIRKANRARRAAKQIQIKIKTR